MSLEVTAKVGSHSSQVILLWGNRPPAPGEKRKFKLPEPMAAGVRFNRHSRWERGVIWKVDPSGLVFISYD